MSTGLVVGGTGPSGPAIVAGLLERGFSVGVLHTGQHEAALPTDAEHIHTDPHFPELVRAELGKRRFDVVIATYGRVRHLADVLRANTDRFISVSGNSYGLDDDPGWGPLGVPLAIEELAPVQSHTRGYSLHHKVWQTERHLRRLHAAGAMSVTIIRYPLVYGPGSPANPDWSVVRRILDGRRVLLLEAGGQLAVNRGYGPNLSLGVLLAVDQPEVTAGRVYNVADVAQYPEGAIASYAAALCGHELEIISVPRHIAARVYRDPVRRRLGYQAFDVTRIRTLGYRDTTEVTEAVRISVNWLLEHPPAVGSEVARQLGDPFDYQVEDEVAAIYAAAGEAAASLDYAPGERGHMYRHPGAAFESWSDAPP